MGRSFVYIEHSGLGNMITATPLLKALRLTYPNDRICVSCWDRSFEAINGLKFIDHIDVRHPAYVIQDERTNGSNIIVTLASPVGAIVDHNVAQLSSHIISNPVKAPWIKHESEYKMDLLHKCILASPPTSPYNSNPLDSQDLSPEFPLDKNGIETTLDKWRLQSGHYCVVNASYLRTDHWYRKHWGNQNYTDLIDRINNKYNIPIVMVGAEADYKEAERFIRARSNCHGHILICCGQTSIHEVAHILYGAYFVIGNDSGLAHLSAAIGQQTYTIFTFTSIIKNAPQGLRSTIICAECDKRISCQHGFWKECTNRICQTVTPEQVMQYLPK